MLARVWSASIVGIDAVKVGVEVDVSGGLPGIVVVGLPDTAVQESRERVKAALKNAGFAFPMRKIVINLTPADLRKEGPSFDLPISVGIMAASEQVSAELLGDYLFLGEVSLDGNLRPVAGLLKDKGTLVSDRPYRSPHHSASGPSLVGGGSFPRPGEISLAHRGVLFLDELTEFKRDVLEFLRQPLEDGHVTISRTRQSVLFPAQFTLVASTNPCPCGYFGDTIQACTCSPRAREQYWAKLSGPLMDRIDLQVAVNRLKPEEITRQPTGEESAPVRERVQAARDRARHRFKNDSAVRCNAQMQSNHLRRWCQLDDTSRNLLEGAIRKLGLSARASDRILKVARTIADLAGDDELKTHHVAEAIQYRTIDRMQ